MKRIFIIFVVAIITIWLMQLSANASNITIQAEEDLTNVSAR